LSNAPLVVPQLANNKAAEVAKINDFFILC
jgi:hypothetical protein